MSKTENRDRLAVLIDAGNVSASVVFELEERAGPQGQKHPWLRDGRKKGDAKKLEPDKAETK